MSQKIIGILGIGGVLGEIYSEEVVRYGASDHWSTKK